MLQSSAQPLSWGSAPYSGRERKGSGYPGASTPRHLASSEFGTLLTPSSPSRLPAISGRAAPGIHLQGLTPPANPGTLSSSRALLAVARPSQRHASNARCRTQSSSRFMTPRERTGKPPPGLCSPREAVPENHPFKVGAQAVALLVFILPRAFPAGSAERWSPLVPLTCFVHDPLPRESGP
jgi:hypothetical protein